MLFDPARFMIGRRTREGREIVVPAFHVCGVEIWGATAMVLAEFLMLIGWTGPSGTQNLELKSRSQKSRRNKSQA